MGFAVEQVCNATSCSFQARVGMRNCSLLAVIALARLALAYAKGTVVKIPRCKVQTHAHESQVYFDYVAASLGKATRAYPSQ